MVGLVIVGKQTTTMGMGVALVIPATPLVNTC